MANDEIGEGIRRRLDEAGPGKSPGRLGGIRPNPEDPDDDGGPGGPRIREVGDALGRIDLDRIDPSGAMAGGAVMEGLGAGVGRPNPEDPDDDGGPGGPHMDVDPIQGVEQQR